MSIVKNWYEYYKYWYEYYKYWYEYYKNKHDFCVQMDHMSTCE